MAAGQGGMDVEDGNQQPSTFLCCNMPNSFDAAAALSKESIL